MLIFPKLPIFDMWPVPWMRDATPSAELPRIFGKIFPQRKWTFSFNIQFLYFLTGQLLIAKGFFRCKNEISRGLDWYEEHDYIAFCFRELPQRRKHKKNLPQAAVRYHFSKFLWHNPAYHYVENKWRCSHEFKHGVEFAPTLCREYMFAPRIPKHDACVNIFTTLWSGCTK